VVSGHITGLTDTMPLRVEKLYNEYNSTAAFTVASALALLALVTLGLKTVLEWKQQRDYARAQLAIPEPESAEVDTRFLARPDDATPTPRS
jgi:sulfate transport system permease protein